MRRLNNRDGGASLFSRLLKHPRRNTRPFGTASSDDDDDNTAPGGRRPYAALEPDLVVALGSLTTLAE